MCNFAVYLRTLRQAGPALAACFLALGSAAEDAGDAGCGSGAVIEEVVVTAQKRSENLQDVPVAVAASWDAYTGPAGRLTLYVDVLNRTDSTSSVGNAEGNGHTRWNGRASFTGSSERWTVGVRGRNLGNEEYTNFYLDARGIGVIAAIIGPPRTYGADVTLRF